jgi:hypothetical protein
MWRSVDEDGRDGDCVRGSYADDDYFKGGLSLLHFRLRLPVCVTFFCLFLSLLFLLFLLTEMGLTRRKKSRRGEAHVRLMLTSTRSCKNGPSACSTVRFAPFCYSVPCLSSQRWDGWQDAKRAG